MLLLVSCSNETVPPPSASLGLIMDTKVPNFALEAENGTPAEFSTFKGKVVVLVPFLTLCQEVCPITAGALEDVENVLKAKNLTNQVEIVEVTVDPERDTPARLRAYSVEFQISWPLFTGSSTALSAMWKYFGIYVQKVPEGSPPGIDWWTGKPLTYDVNHSDGYILLDKNGYERFVTTSLPNTGRKLSPSLKKLLDPQGLTNLNSPSGLTWTPNELLSEIGWLLDKNL